MDPTDADRVIATATRAQAEQQRKKTAPAGPKPLSANLSEALLVRDLSALAPSTASSPEPTAHPSLQRPRSHPPRPPCLLVACITLRGCTNMLLRLMPMLRLAPALAALLGMGFAADAG